MTTLQLRIWSILTRSLVAPFNLSLASWKALLKPVFALVVFSGLLLAFSYFKLNPTLQLLAQLPFWASIAWFALDYQRHLVIGPSAPTSESRMWPTYGAFFIVFLLLCLCLALLLGLLLYLVLPGIAWFLMALNSPKPWLASGAVVLWVLVVGVAAYPVVRLAMALPAISARHDISLKRIWHLSQGHGIKLLLLLVLVPGLPIGYNNIAFEAYTDLTWATLFVGILETYFALFYLSILALSYRVLSGQPIPTKTNQSISSHLLGSRFLWPSVFILVAGMFLAVVFEAVYIMEPGQDMIITRLGKPDRVKSGSGIRLKIPFIEETQPVSEKERHKIEGSQQFYMITKDRISITYGAYWHVIDSDTFFRATAGQTLNVSRRLEHRLQNQLRNQISRLRPAELHEMIEQGTNQFSIEDEPDLQSPFDAVLKEVNARARELGIEMTTWHFEIDPS